MRIAGAWCERYLRKQILLPCAEAYEMKCPCCPRPVLRVDQKPTQTLYVHAVAGKDGKQVYGCAVARREGTNQR
jgi:hypothetical protein